MNRIYLTGPSCSGKSTLAKHIALKYNLSYADLDEEIEKHTKRSIDDIFAYDGEEEFRDLESKVLSYIDADIIATGGGTALRAANMEYMKKHGRKVVLLIAPADVLLKRLKHSYKRPLLQGDLLDSIQKQIYNRAYAYCMADQIINTGVLSVANSVDVVYG